MATAYHRDVRSGVDAGGFVNDLERLVGNPEATAREAFERLWRATRPAVVRGLVRRGTSSEEAEDVAQTVATEIWKVRGTVRARTGGEWYGLAWTSATREAGARAAKAGRETSSETLDAVPAEEMDVLDRVFMAAQRARLDDALDRLWLGEVECPADAARGTVALQHLLLDGLAEEEIAAMLGASAEDLRRWMADPAVVRRALFSAVCWPGDALAGYVLCPERPLGTDELNALSATGEGLAPDSAWSGLEVRVLLLRLREGMRERAILATEKELDPLALKTILCRLRAAFPLRDHAETFREGLAARGRADALAGVGTWKRVAVEYHVREDLPHRQIVERAGPPAEELDYRLDEARLNNWLSMGRLFTELADWLAEEEA